MDFFAPAKINLSLEVKGRRPDGFHEIETLICPISLVDELRIERTRSGGVHLVCDDVTLPTGADNLVIRAALLFSKQLGDDLNLEIHLSKRIPHGAGLGGGSSDAAETLLALDGIYGTRLSLDALTAMAAELGSDVPFFIQRSAALCQGRGEQVTAVLFANTLPLVLMKPPFGVPTPSAYQRWSDSREIPGVPYAAQQFAWGVLRNDLERPVFEKHLFLALLKQWLLEQPEVAGALLSGSGSTVFAVLHETNKSAQLRERATARFGEHLWFCACETRPSGQVTDAPI